MKEWVKNAGIQLLSRPPIYPMLRTWALRKCPTTILCYHTLRPATQTFNAWTVVALENFQVQVKYFRQHYEIVSLTEALDRQGQAGRPRAVLTFDDGEIGLYDHLLPLVTAERLPVTIYVATGQIAQCTPYWFDRVMNALHGEAKIEIDLHNEGLGYWLVGPSQGKERWSQISKILEELKKIPQKKRDRLVDLIVSQADVNLGSPTQMQPMKIAQLKEIASNPLVTIGAHSHGHELLDQIPVKEACASIARSKICLENWIGEEIIHFAYPNGNYNPELMIEIEKLGFASAAILDDNLAPSGNSPFALSRIGVGRYDGLERLSLRMAGV